MAKKTKTEKTDAKSKNKSAKSPKKGAAKAGASTGKKSGTKSKAKSKAKAADPNVTHEAIAERAYQIYLARGAAPGTAQSDWDQAERELRQET